MNKTEQYTAIGDFYLSAINFIKNCEYFPNTKLQKIVGMDIYMRTINGWFFNNSLITSMEIEELMKLTEKLK